MHNRPPFFVTGLPRSRTAWVANWLTNGESLCYHDEPYDESRLKADRWIGFSGPELVLQYRQIHQLHPGSPWLVLMRDPEQCLKSLREWGGYRWPRVSGEILREFWDSRREIVDDIGNQPRSKRVGWKTLDNEPAARDILAWLMPGVEFDAERWSILVKMNVQQQLP